MRFDGFIFQEYSVSPSSLGIFRILYAISILAIYLPQGLWIASFPSSFFNPPIGLTIFLSVFHRLFSPISCLASTPPKMWVIESSTVPGPSGRHPRGARPFWPCCVHFEFAESTAKKFSSILNLQSTPRKSFPPF
jgi:hypothetical protein